MHVTRIIDANANRAREAMRVMEEAARFILDDAELTGQLKALRHELAAALEPLGALETRRDTPGDVGTQLATSSEGTRESVAHVAAAAGKRLSEALRAIEEYAKLLPMPDEAASHPAARVEQLRYRAYELERRLAAALGPGERRQYRLCALVSESLCPGGDWLGVAEACLAGGADCIQLREKTLAAGELLARARRLAQLCRSRQATLIVNDRPDVALAAGAHGVHVGQQDMPVREIRRLFGRQLVVGVSTSRLEQAKEAKAQGADYCGVGPMFATATKDKPELAGPQYMRAYAAWNALPHLAIGGITLENVDELVAAGARGIAVSSTLCKAGDPAATARALVEVVAGGAVSSEQ